jgi:hypothetical protein
MSKSGTCSNAFRPILVALGKYNAVEKVTSYRLGEGKMEQRRPMKRVPPATLQKLFGKTLRSDRHTTNITSSQTAILADLGKVPSETYQMTFSH